jgi:membrane protease YdiL (CAAX protease family)
VPDLSEPVPVDGPVAPIHPGPVGPDPERPEGLPRTGDVSGEARWKPWSAPLALVAGLFAALVGGLLVLAVASIFGANASDPPPSVDLISTVIQDLCLIGAAIVFAGMVARPKPWQFGLRLPQRIWLSVGWLALAYVAFLIVSAAWISALGLGNEKDTLPKELGAKDSDVAMIAVGFLVCVVAPFAEEFFFRGFFFRAVANWKGVWPAAIITGLVFGLIHATGSPIGFLLPLAFLGFVLCLLYWKTGSLYPCIALHCLNNSFAYGSAVGWTWQTPVCLVASLALLSAILLVVRRIAGAPPAPAIPIAAAQPA